MTEPDIEYKRLMLRLSMASLRKVYRGLNRATLSQGERGVRYGIMGLTGPNLRL
jgi:hypothetical protein